jgi:hypothetical protein
MIDLRILQWETHHHLHSHLRRQSSHLAVRHHNLLDDVSNDQKTKVAKTNHRLGHHLHNHLLDLHQYKLRAQG